jgi:hypothetical protein
MADQLCFPFASDAFVRPQRRVLWRQELARLAQTHADERARDAQRQAEAIMRLEGQLADLCSRIAEIERGLGLSGINRQPGPPCALLPRTVARRAAVALTRAGADDAETVRTMLLADLRELFAAEPSGVLFTKEILGALAKRDDRPWPKWKAGKPITNRQLAALLKPLEIARQL